MRRAAASVLALATAGVLGVGAAAVAAPDGGSGGGGWGYRSGGGSSDGVSCTDGAGGGAAWAGRGRAGGIGRGTAGGGMAGRGAGGGSGAGSQVPVVPGATISEAVAGELVFMVQEEKLARDVYQLAAARYPDRVFTNIARSEATHLAAVRTLLDRYDVDDPTLGATPGEFVDEGLRDLYERLAAQVEDGRDQAIQAGITVEQADIADLREALALDAPTDVDTVLGNLLAASQRHLAAFQRNA